ncbi:MAG: ABC transporter permease [Butyrivibrio sp.]|nr:ABC transporter permease [Butyrivibrio sp.]
MTKLTFKTLTRTMRSTLGRYLAILAIIALGVGFFTGLKNAQPSMRATADEYFSELNMYDFRLVSSLGFTKEDIAVFESADGISCAEGGRFLDVLSEGEDGNMLVYKLLSLPQKTALPKLVSGRLPQSADECAADSFFFTKEDIGRKITLAPENSAETAASLACTEFTIVGLTQSPRFISSDRGSASVGNGEIAAFLYILPEAFRDEIYSELLLAADTDEAVFSDGYDSAVSALAPDLETLLWERILARHEQIKAETGMPDLPEPTGLVLTLDSNSGCASFKNDTVIVSGIANAFPVFFVLIAALVCVTTMTRMVDEERTQIGTLKALGYRSITISGKYILYATSASLIGCVAGFFLGTGLIPRVIWSVYAVSYGFADLSYCFSPVMYACCLAVSLLGSAAVTLFACGRELREKPSELIRPKPPANGGRVLLERVSFIWKKMSFLWKATIRNAFRYKKRMIMMLIGISGCTALLVTGFGLKDSLENIIKYQYDEIMLCDASVSFDAEEQTMRGIDALLADKAVKYEFAYRENLIVGSDEAQKEACVIAISPESSDTYFDLHNKKGRISYPSQSLAVVSSKLAKQLGVSEGGTLSVLFGGETVSYTVADVCDNYLGHYIYVSPSSVPAYKSNTVFLRETQSGAAGIASADLRALSGVSYVQISSQERALMQNSMSSINYIVLLVILCAALLALIVLYNLTNINIMERVREVATVKVLGFHSSETSSYVLNENVLLSVLGAFLGLALGKLLHRYVIAQVQVDSMAFDVRINALSYLISFACTVLFALLANLLMRSKLAKVNMAESLKAVE